MGLTFRTGALVDAIYTDSSNKVGIGTSTLTAGIPLSINVATGNNCNVAFQENASDKWYLRNITSSNAFSFYSVAGGAEVMRLSSSGNVGISTTSPAARLDVRVPVESPATGAVALIAGTSNGANDIFRWFDGATQLGVFKNSGFVGIGTSSPVGPLDIAVPATGSAIGATNAQQAYDYSRLRIKHYTDSNLGLSIGYAGANYTYIQACYNQGTTAPLFLNPFGSNISIGNNIDAGFRLYVKHPTAGQYIEAGTTSAHSSFQVNDFTGGTTYFRIRGDGYLQSLTTYNNTTAAGANVSVSSSGYFERSTSSIKYKKDVRDYNKGLAEVMAMRPVYYKGKGENDGDKQFAGLIAEEIDALGLTEFVQYAEDKSPDSLYYANMVALLIKAIQELNAKVTALENK